MNNVQVYGQLLSQEQLKKEKAFVSLEQALKTPEKVIKLELWSSNLHEFPSEIFRFKNLQVLNLNFNQIKTLPDNLYQLKYLQVLRLGHNQLSRFPTGLEKLVYLRILDLHGNQLKNIPSIIRHLKRLEELHLHENQLKKVHPNWQHLAYLRFLNLSENQLQSLPITKKHSLKKLKMLILVENKMSKGEQSQLQQLLQRVEVRF
ncbi:hypothetical protein BKI52_26505 [marine bacterium AO1-C]|nr:hypothetical protein BKI52_26505 [marine bacterium AO1-C]